MAFIDDRKYQIRLQFITQVKYYNYNYSHTNIIFRFKRIRQVCIERSLWFTFLKSSKDTKNSCKH